MKPFDPTEFQPLPNGPLGPTTIARILAIKDRKGMSYAGLGNELGISGTFLHNLIHKGANVGTQHIERIATAIERLENPEQASQAGEDVVDNLEHTFHLRPGLQIRLQLPADLTSREAERLSQFVKSLPVA